MPWYESFSSYYNVVWNFHRSICARFDKDSCSNYISLGSVNASLYFKIFLNVKNKIQNVKSLNHPRGMSAKMPANEILNHACAHKSGK